MRLPDLGGSVLEVKRQHAAPRQAPCVGAHAGLLPQLAERRGHDVGVVVLLDLAAEAVVEPDADAALLPAEEEAVALAVVDEDEREELFGFRCCC